MSPHTCTLLFTFGALLAAPACADKGDDTGGSGDDSAADDSDGGDDSGGSDDIAIAGSWTDNYGGDHVITNASWSQYGGSSLFAFTTYDNDEAYAIAQNDSANEYNPDLYSRFDWTWDASDQLWYCQTAYAAMSAEEAEATAAADPADPSTTGCSGFPWTSLTPAS